MLQNELEDASVVIAPKPTVYESSSEHNRMGKEFQATAQLTGIGPGLSGTTGVNAGMFLDRNSPVQLEYMRGDGEFLWTRTKVQTVGVHFKQHFGNSFYVNSGLDHRQIKMYDDFDWFTTSRGEMIGEAESIVASVAIGNQWQFKNFTLGCDWFGLSFAVAKLSSRYNGNTYSEDDKRRAKEDWDDVAGATTGNLLRFYLGASW